MIISSNVICFCSTPNIYIHIYNRIAEFAGKYWRSNDVCWKFYLKIDQMKYRSSMERCPVGGLTMMTSFLAALTMTSSFGPKSRTSTGWSNMALVSTSFLLASISRRCLTWRTSTARSNISNWLIFDCDDHNSSTTRSVRCLQHKINWLQRTMPSWENYRVATFFSF